MTTHRKQMRIPHVIMQQVTDYQRKNGISTLTSAFLELVRKGLDVSKKDNMAS